MNSKKLVIGGIIGGVVIFLAGWLIYGILLMDYMAHHSRMSSGAFRSETEMIMWAMALGNLGFGFLISFLLSKLNVNDLKGGLIYGALLGLFISFSMDMMLYAQLNIWGKGAIVADVIGSTIMFAIAGAVIGLVNGKLK
ncbi:MAG: hypothetical protein U0T11_07425 [Chitinophagaceae bacterium]